MPDRARTAFSPFDQPDIRARYDLTLDVPANWTAIANAPLESVAEQAKKARYRFATSDPISSYLFFLAANPTYNRQLRMKILQAADKPMRAQRILAAAR